MATLAICLAGAMGALPEVVDRLNQNLISVFGDSADVFLYAPIDRHRSRWEPYLDKILRVKEKRVVREDISNQLRRDIAAGGYQEAVSGGVWSTINLPGNFLGCYDGMYSSWEDEFGNKLSRPGSGLCQMYSLKSCMEMISDAEIKQGRRYQQVMVTRPDFVWIKPHMPLMFLDPHNFWIMDEDISAGVIPTYTNDRHWIMPRDVAPIMMSNWDRLINGSLIMSVHARLGDDIFDPDPKHQEAFWASRLDAHGLILENVYAFLMYDYGFEHIVRHFPCAVYILCKSVHDRTTISVLEEKQIVDDADQANPISVLEQVDNNQRDELLNNSHHKDTMFHRNHSCVSGGPKNFYEGVTAWHLARGMDDKIWDCESLWECWCSKKLSYDVSWSVYPSQLLCMGCLAFLDPARQDYWVNHGKRVENILPYHTHESLMRNESLRLAAQRNDFARWPSEKLV